MGGAFLLTLVTANQDGEAPIARVVSKDCKNMMKIHSALSKNRPHIKQ